MKKQKEELPVHLPILFLKNHMVLPWYGQDELFKVYEFVKVEQVSARDWMLLARNHNVRSLYLSKYTARLARFIGKLPYCRFMWL